MELTLELAQKFYREMLLIRRFEEKCVELYSAEKIRGFLHLCIGEEAVAAGVMHALSPDDAVVSTYREHGHALARGITPESVMAEMYGKAAGCSGGRGGSMHLYDATTRFYGGNAIVGGGLPIAVGLALADKMQNNDRVTVCLFGDGAVAEGEFHESLNLAALWQLPILFICENNRYAMGTALQYTESETNLAQKAQSYHVNARQVDGMDVIAVADAVARDTAAIKAGNGPMFIECLTYRFRAHSMFDPELYRTKAEVAGWKEHDPLITLQQQLEAKGLWESIDINAMEDDIATIVADAVDFAESAPIEPVEDLEKFVYSPEVSR